MSSMVTRNIAIHAGAETPWHGLANRVAANATPEEMMVAGGVNWPVRKHRLAMRTPDGQLVTETLDNYRAIVKGDGSNYVFQIATQRYNPVQNQDVVGFFQEFCESGDAQLEIVGSLKDSAIVWALAKLNSGDGTIGCSEDVGQAYIMLATSHDGSLQTVVKATDVYVVCWNTMSAALAGKGAMWSLKHSAKFNGGMSKAKNVVRMSIEAIQANHEIACQLAKVKIDEKGRIEFINRLIGGKSLLEQVIEDNEAPILSTTDLLGAAVERTMATEGDEANLNRVGKAILNRIIDSPGSDLQSRKGTLWGAVNGVTYYVDHERARTTDARMFNGQFGDGDRMKRTALQVAIEMAGVK